MKKENPLIGKAQRMIAVLCLICTTSINGTMVSYSKTTKSQNETIMVQKTKSLEKFLGGLSPAEALAYMKATPDLYIIDVREWEWYKGYPQFTGNVHIPRSKLAERYKEIPANRPVILNCGAGIQAPRAYEFLKKINADILQLSYIDGSPRFQEYNEWVVKQHQ